jgi:hypothetical protein
MLGNAIERNENGLAATRLFTTDTDCFLRHHVFGPSSLTAGHDVKGVAIIPFTFSMESVAEAAFYLAGWRRSAFTLSNVTANRWLALDDKQLITQIVAEPLSSTRQKVRVRVFELDGSNRRLAFESVASCNMRGLARGRVKRTEASEPSITAEEFNSRIFHGPLLSTFRRTITVGADGAEIEAVMPSNHGMFKDCCDPRLMTPAALLDATGQLVGYWLMERQLPSFVLPFRLARYEQFLSPPQPGTTVRLRSHISLRNEIATANIDITTDHNTMLAQLTGLQMKLYVLPDRYMHYIFHHTHGSRLSEKADQSLHYIYKRRIDAGTHSFLSHGHSIWGRLLARMVLSDEEKQTWRRLDAHLQIPALLSTVVAKEVMLDWLASHAIVTAPTNIHTRILRNRVVFSCTESSTSDLRLPDGLLEQLTSHVVVSLLSHSPMTAQSSATRTQC